MSKYTVEISGHSWRLGPVYNTDTLKSARKIAVEYGPAADWADVYRNGKLVASYRRNPDGDGWTWYRRPSKPS